MFKAKLSDWYSWLVAGIVFCMPANLFWKWAESSAYVQGRLVDYLLPKIFLTDLLIAALGVIWLSQFSWPKLIAKIKKVKPVEWGIVAIGVAIAGRQLATNYQLASSWYLFKLIEMGWLGWFWVAHQSQLTTSIINKAARLALLFQSALAIYQFHFQKPLLGYLFLGEPNLLRPLGITTQSWWGAERILPYGTTPHPNVLGGVLAILILWRLAQHQKRLRFDWLLLVAGGYALFLTQSVSAWLTLGLGIIILTAGHQLKRLSAAVLIGFFIIILGLTPVLVRQISHHQASNLSLSRRAYLNRAAASMWSAHPIWGVGLNQFTTQVESYASESEVVRFVQPVHHLGLLWLAETGLIGVSLITSLMALLINRDQSKTWVLVGLLPILTLDHYLLTTQTGLLLLVFSLTQLSIQLQNCWSSKQQPK